jgi:uncharacterized protein (TIGR02284 family)
MMSTREHDGSTALIADLVRANTESAKGFDWAADSIHNRLIASLFRRFARDRLGQVLELRTLINAADAEQIEAASLPATLRRWWVSLRGMLNGGDDRIVLSEAERGESAVLRRYEEALRCVTEPGIRELLARQRADVKRAYDELRELREAASGLC